MKKRSRDPVAMEYIKEALLCKLFKCTPDQLDEISFEKVEAFETVYAEVLKHNPLMAFG